MSLKPLGDRVIVKVDKAEEKTAGGLILTSDNKEKPSTGKVVAVGPGKEDEKMPVKEGDKVLFSKYGGTEVKVDGEELLILSVSDIYGVFN